MEKQHTVLGKVLFLVLLFALSLGAGLTAQAAENEGAVTARPIVANPPKSNAAPSSVYGQTSSKSLPMDGIVVKENKSLDMQIEDELDDYDDEPVQSIADPLEGWNRFWFGFNDIFYVYVAKPAYTAWETITPHQVREGLSNFWHNLLFPMRFVKTLGRWGIPHGCYLVWPFIGPSSVRETFGWAGDYFAYPGFAVGYAWKAPWYVISGIEVGFFFNDLDDVLPTYMSIRDAAVDPYIMMREAWVRYRAIQVAR